MEFIDFIQSVGFPIVACYALWKSNERNNENHKAEVDELRTAIENNTQVMIKLCGQLNMEDDGK